MVLFGSFAFTVFGCVLCSIWTYYQLKFYARADTPKEYFAAVFVSWWLGITSITVLLPLDLAAANYGDKLYPGVNNTKPDSASRVVEALWKTNYWLTFVWCWVVCPFVMEFWAAGDFSNKEKMKTALRNNLKFYGYALIVLLMIAIFIAFSKHFWPSQLAGYLVAAANSYGMFLIVFMLGYGLVEIPRVLWIRTNPRKRLRHLEFSAGLIQGNMLDAKAELEEKLRAFYRFEKAAQKLKQDPSNLSSKVQQVLATAQQICEANSIESTILLSTDGRQLQETVCTERELARIHYELKATNIKYERALNEWEDILAASVYLENQIQLDDDVSQSNGNDSHFTRLASNSQDFSHSRWAYNLIECTRQSLAMKFISFSATMFSLILFWCECVSPFSEALSIFAVLTRAATNAFLLQVFSCLCLVYMAICAYFALFKFKLLESLALYGNQQSDAYSLLYNACYFGRLQFSLGVNYLLMLYPDDRGNTAFSALVGDMDVVPFLGTSFNNYVPVLLVLVAISTFFKVFDRVLNRIGVETRMEPIDGLLEHEEKIDNGREQVLKARRLKAQKKNRVQQRRRGSGYELNKF